jgi:ribosomal protein S27E
MKKTIYSDKETKKNCPYCGKENAFLEMKCKHCKAII